MKKDLISLSIIAVIAMGAFVTSCSKSSSKSVSERLVGNWSLAKTATDGNANGKADASEWQGLSFDTLGFHITYTLSMNVKTGGSGMANLSVAIPLSPYSDSALFSWATANNNQNVTVTTTDSILGSFINGSFHIDSLADHVLILKKDTAGAAFWLYMTK